MEVLLAQPRGFCAGVERAIDIVETALVKYGAPIYVRHEIVHNRRVVETLRSKGVRFVAEIDEIPTGAIAVFSAHGVSKKVVDNAEKHGLQAIDATCPLVSKVHKEGQRYAKRGFEVILIGHKNHPEVEGTMGQIDGTVHLVSEVSDISALNVNNPDKLAFVTQTTLSVDDTKNIIENLRRRFPKIVGPNVKDICYATQNRQNAVRELAEKVEMILVVGSRNSSNTNRLHEVASDAGVPSYLVEGPDSIDFAWLEGIRAVGITAGASAPDELVQDVIDRLRKFAHVNVSTMQGIIENVTFALPVILRDTKTVH